MKKWLILLLLTNILLTSCNIQKHVETERLTTTNNKLDITEKTDKNTTRFIIITKYQEKKDSTTGEYPVESITEIKEVNNDKITTNTKEESKESTEETISMDLKTEPSYKWYIICFFSGVVFMLLIFGLIKLIKLYIKRSV